MPVVVRKTLAVVLAVLAVLAAALGLGARTAYLIVNTPEPLQRILGPLATNERLLEVLPQELGTQLAAQIAADVPVPRLLQGPLETAISQSGAALVSDPGFASAWNTTIENTRRDYVAKLDAAAASGQREATLELDLAPLVTSAYGTLFTSLEGSALGRLLPQDLEVPPVVVDTNWPQEETLSADAANRWLALAAGWGWLLAAAAVLLAGALLLAPRDFRGRVFIVTGAASLVLAVVLVVFGYNISGMPVQGSELTRLVVEQLATGVRGELREISNALIIGGVVALLAALGTWIWRKDNPVELG